MKGSEQWSAVQSWAEFLEQDSNQGSVIQCQELVCVEVLWPSQPNGVMSSAVSLPNHTFTGQA